MRIKRSHYQPHNGAFCRCHSSGYGEEKVTKWTNLVPRPPRCASSARTYGPFVTCYHRVFSSPLPDSNAHPSVVQIPTWYLCYCAGDPHHVYRPLEVDLQTCWITALTGPLLRCIVSPVPVTLAECNWYGVNFSSAVLSVPKLYSNLPERRKVECFREDICRTFVKNSAWIWGLPIGIVSMVRSGVVLYRSFPLSHWNLIWEKTGHGVLQRA